MAEHDREAAAYWASQPFEPYHQDGRQRSMIVNAVIELQRRAPGTKIRSIFELGCNVGRNLERLRTQDPSLELVGMDINEAAVADGRARYGLDLRVGDEHLLAAFPENRFDCAFTVSVLDHIPDIDAVRATLRALQRITRSYLLILEPFNGANGRAPDIRTRFNYYWNYPMLFREMGARLLSDVAWPLGFNTPFRRAYRLFVVGLEPDLPRLGFGFRSRRQLERLRFRWTEIVRSIRSRE